MNGLTGVGGAFSNPTERFGEKSQFNKEKWLPAARDLPFRISHYCCQVMKKRPLHEYQKLSDRKSYIGTLAEESRVRKQAWIRRGCNAFDGKNPSSQPLSFWRNQDILQYIQENKLEIAKPYGRIECVNSELHCTGCDRTGCVYCMFGAHLKDDRRFLELKEIDPRQYEYAMGGGQWVDNPDYDPFAPEYDGEWKNWNPPKIWVPSKEGLGLKFVIDEFNKIYTKNKILY